MAQFSDGVKRQQEEFGFAPPTGDVIFVDSTNGSDGNDGVSKRDAVKTLTQAVSLAQAGDMIVLEPGGSETVSAAIAVALASLRIVCDTRGNPRSGFALSGAGTLDLISVTAADVHVEGLQFKHTGTTANASGLLASAAAHRLTVQDCAFDDTAIVTTHTGVGVELTAGADDQVVDGCLFLDVKYGVQIAASSTNESDRTTIKDSTFHVGIVAGGFGVHAASATGKVQSPRIVGCKFIEANGDGADATTNWDGDDGTNATTGPILFGAAVDQYMIADCQAVSITKSDTFANIQAINAGAAGEQIDNATGTSSDISVAVDSVGTAVGSVGTVVDAIDAASVGTLVTSVGVLAGSAATDTEAASVGTLATSVGTAVGSVGTLVTTADTAVDSVGTQADSLGTQAGSVGTLVSSVGTVADAGATSTEAGSVGTLVSSVGTVADAGATSTEAGSVGTLVSSVGTVADAGATSTEAGSVGTLVSSVGTVADAGATSTEAGSVGTAVDSVGTQVTTVDGWDVRTVASTGVVLTGGAVEDCFTVANGPVEVLSLLLHVTAAVSNNACNAKWQSDPTVGASSTDLSDVVDIAQAAQGDCFYITGASAANMVKAANGTAAALECATHPIVFPGGVDLSLANSDPTTGAATAYIVYRPLASDASVA